MVQTLSVQLNYDWLVVDKEIIKKHSVVINEQEIWSDMNDTFIWVWWGEIDGNFAVSQACH